MSAFMQVTGLHVLPTLGEGTSSHAELERFTLGGESARHDASTSAGLPDPVREDRDGAR